MNIVSITETDRCPCGSGEAYGECCARWHRGTPAPTAEALMRSRFSAYVLKLKDYLLATWHRDFRPHALDLEGGPEWVGLKVLAAREQAYSAQVHFVATWRQGERWGALEERSDFLREDGVWQYTSGETHEFPLRPGRNDACPCGSGRKFKKCCAA